MILKSCIKNYSNNKEYSLCITTRLNFNNKSRLFILINKFNFNKKESYTSGKDIIDYLKQRLTYYNSSLNDFKINKNEKVYIGFDPTANKLHIGNLLGIVNALRFIPYGLKPMFLLGGATGLIGDPSGKSKERPQLNKDLIKNNLNELKNQIHTIATSIISSKEYKDFLFTNNNLNSISPSFEFINNYDFYKDMNVIEFFRDVGCNLRLSSMLSKDTVKNRLDSDKGISLTEFMYQALQGYDFYYLQKNFNVRIQLGGSDQWGNMTTGLDLINKINKNLDKLESVINITHPLLTTTCGKKLGKSEGNAISLCFNNPNLMYQYLVNLSDDDVKPLLYKLTFYSEQDIEDIVLTHLKQPEKRLGQKKLAETILSYYCNKSKLEEAIYYSNNYFKSELNNNYFENCSKINISIEYFNHNKTLSSLLQDFKIINSKSQVKRLIGTKSIKLNNKLVEYDEIISVKDTFFENKYLLVQTGKTNKHVFSINN